MNVKLLLSNMYKNGSCDTKEIADTVVDYANRKNKKRYDINVLFS